ncbi:diacylglycerol kinase family protein [Polaribacter sp. HaHaR_3_91]|jgi:YegS/Rv2252/BmrU family lipid kinase|uniref:diacylglycerol/lipid kinase family protein n=1 Tax=Polaribacter sp. HaHaR_3_91 TaxID=2745561 RepID=UPI001C4FC047|nr:diacylglycerol kinase family protein [Polaribacter sp. HaHaR_3_91]QXP63787.1 diacylglycerol kinase family lipid kinase [Polaribacter sp. HaHaR_3_91]
MSTSWFIIANPISGNRNFSKQWKEIQQLLNNKKIDFSFAFTKFSKHEIELVDTAIQQGFRNIISIGGDGTLHNVVNGIMTQRYAKTSDITIAVIPQGTGNDWIKTYNIPNSVKKAIEIIHKKNIILQDIGVLKTDNRTVFFNNVAGLGYDGYIVNKLKTLKSFGSLAYILSGIAGLLLYKKTVFKIIFDDKILETNCLMTVFGICKFSGGGMQFTKNVNSTDGLLDITIAKNLTILDLILNLPKLYSGKIVDHKKLETYKTKAIRVVPKTAKPFIQADGEIIGTGEVHVKIIEKAINFVVN